MIQVQGVMVPVRGVTDLTGIIEKGWKVKWEADV